MSDSTESIDWASALNRSATDLVLAFRRLAADSYEVTPLEPLRGEATKVVLPVVTLTRASADLSRSTRAWAGRDWADPGDAEPPEPEVEAPNFQPIGTQLFEALFVGSVREAYLAAREQSAHREGQLRIVLDFTDALELSKIPWEALFEPPVFISTQRGMAVVRRAAGTEVLRPILVKGQLSVLGVIANPVGERSLDVEKERASVEAALAPLVTAGLVRLNWLEPATVAKLRVELAKDYHVLHYIGHSAAPDEETEAVLILERDDGTPDPLGGLALANLIGKHSQLRLAVLNSCESAVIADGDPFSAIATHLVELGVPAVIAMQYVVGDDAAIAFGRALYQAIAQDRQGGVVEAITDARLTVFLEGHDVDWVAPVLFMQSPDSRLFDLSLIGWYTLNGSRPARTPPPFRPGFLGLSLYDPLERAIALLGKSYDDEILDEIAGGLHAHESPTRIWTFQGQSRVCVTYATDVIEQLQISVDPDEVGDLRVMLPYGVVLGESSLAEADAAIRAQFPPEYLEGHDIGPMERPLLGEGFTYMNWLYLCPDGPADATYTIEIGAGISWEDPDYQDDLDWGKRRVSNFLIRPRDDENDWSHEEPDEFGVLSDEEADEFSALLEEVCPEDLVSTLETNTEELRDALAQARTLLGPDADRDMIAGAATAIVEFYTVKSRERTELEFAEQYQAQADRVRKRIEGLRLAKAAMAAGEVKPVY